MKFLIQVTAVLLLKIALGTTAVAQDGRSSEGLRVLYDFSEGEGDIVKDGAGELDLKISKMNGVKRSAGALEITGDTIIRSEKPAQDLAEAIRNSQAITIEAWIRPENTRQEGPARIVTFSKDSRDRNFTVGQEKGDFDVRFLAAKTNANGQPSTVSGGVKTELTHVVYTREKSGTGRLYLNGQQQSEQKVEGDLGKWDENLHLALGNEMNGDRLWRGAYYLVAIFDRALPAEEIGRHFKAGINAKIPAPTVTQKTEPKPEPEVASPVQKGNRTERGLLALYDFSETDGDLIRDRAGRLKTSLDLKIKNLASIRRGTGQVEVKTRSEILSVNSAEELISAIKKSGETTVEAWITPATLNQEGPARIVSLSENTSVRNFTLGQEKDVFNVRCRTTQTDNNGMSKAPVTSGKSVNTRLTHVAYTRDRNGKAWIYVDGKRQDSVEIGGSVANWDSGQKLALANETTGDRPWLGTFHLVALYDRALNAGEIRGQFLAGPDAKGGGTEFTSNSENAHLFETEIAPLIANRCLECHDPATREGKLDLSQKEFAFAGGKRDGHGIVPGKLEESAIWKSVVEDEMPEDRDPLTDAEKAALKKWIEGGANWTVERIDPAVYVHGGGGKAAKIWVQRLTVPEYIATVKTATGIDIAEDARALLPADLRADGFSNTAYNLNVDLKHVGAYSRLAELITDRMDVAAFAKRFTKSDRLDDDKKMEAFVKNLGLWLLRGPLEQDEIYGFRGVLTTVAAAQGDFDEAARYLIEAMLQSPRFIYRIETQRGDGTAWPVTEYELASRISYLLWGSGPDQNLLDAAQRGELSNPAKLSSQISRMLEDDRAVDRSLQFASEWLNLGRLANLAPDEKHFPDWNPQLAEAMRAETLSFFEDVVWKQNRPLSELLSAQMTFADPQLATFYGLEAKSSDGEFVKYDLSKNPERGGLLTQASILTIGGDEASMVSRGLFVMHDLLRGVVKDPPPCVDVTPVPSKPGLTQRGIAEERIANVSCGGCHMKFEPLAFGLEKFDGIGAFHEKDQFGNQLREDGEILFPGDSESIKYKTGAELMELLAASNRVKETLTWKLTQYAMGRPLTAQEVSDVEMINDEAQRNGGTYQATMKAIATSDLVRLTRTEKN